MSMVDDHMPKIYNDELTTPHRDALSLLNCTVGSCRDDCDRYIFAMRACGIPVSSDMILCSPDNGTSHQWMVIRDNHTKMICSSLALTCIRSHNYPCYKTY